MVVREECWGLGGLSCQDQDMSSARGSEVPVCGRLGGLSSMP